MTGSDLTSVDSKNDSYKQDFWRKLEDEWKVITTPETFDLKKEGSCK